MTDKILTRRQILGTTSVAFLGGFAGCSEVLKDINATAPESESSGDTKSQPTREPPALSGPTATSEPTDDSEPTADSGSTDDSEPTDDSGSTPAESWTQPETPHQPTEDKLDGRIDGVDIINTQQASGGSGYADFDFRVGANTWLEDVDPEPEPDGNPYFAVEINGTLVARTDVVPFREQGSFEIPVEQGALEQFDPGTLEIRILLLDIDKQTDDLYGEWTGTVEYQPA